MRATVDEPMRQTPPSRRIHSSRQRMQTTRILRRQTRSWTMATLRVSDASPMPFANAQSIWERTMASTAVLRAFSTATTGSGDLAEKGPWRTSDGTGCGRFVWGASLNPASTGRPSVVTGRNGLDGRALRDQPTQFG